MSPRVSFAKTIKGNPDTLARLRTVRDPGLIHHYAFEEFCKALFEKAGVSHWPTSSDPVALISQCHRRARGDDTPVLYEDECRRLAPRLRELVRDWPDVEYNEFSNDIVLKPAGYKHYALMIASGCDECVREGVEFAFTW